MKIASVAMLCVLVSSRAWSGEYSDAVDKQRRCETAGELAASFFGKDKAYFRAELNKVDTEMKAKRISSKLGSLTMYIMLKGHMAKSKRDAYMQGWALCMDEKE